MKQLQGGFKLRTSCATCRARHVKCDGHRPACIRCTESLRSCAGYESSETIARQFKMIHYFVPSPSKTPPSLPDAEFDELRSLDFYTSVTAPELGGPFAVDMWVTIVRIAYSQPATQHALTALGALHEHVKKCGYTKDSEYPIHALRQYGKAMRELLGTSLKPSVDNTLLALVSCLIFAAFDHLRGHYASALTHINGGVRIFAENSTLVDAYDDEAAKSCKKLLQLSFLRSDSQTVEMAALATTPIVRRLATNLDPIPEKFGSIEQAYHTFEIFFNHFIHLELHIDDIFDQIVSMDVQECRLDESLRLENYFRAWCSAFDTADFKESCTAVRILQLHKIAVPLFRTAPYQSETDFDMFMPEFEHLIAIGETFLNDTDYYPKFTLSLGIVHIFFFVVYRCRDPVLRRRALDILWRCKRREGIWDSEWAAQIGEKIIHIEEASADAPVTEAGQISETARIVALDTLAASDRSVAMIYHKSGIGTRSRDALKGKHGMPVRNLIVDRIGW